MPVPLISVNSSGVVLFLNSQARLLLGSNIQDLHQVFKEDIHFLLKKNEKLQQDHKPLQMQSSKVQNGSCLETSIDEGQIRGEIWERDLHLKSDGRLVLVKAQNDGQIINMALFDLSGISELDKSLEVQRAEQIENIQRSTEKKIVTEFMHEINNPLMIAEMQYKFLESFCREHCYKLEPKESKQVETGLNKLKGALQRIKTSLFIKKEILDPEANQSKSSVYTQAEKALHFYSEDIRLLGVAIQLDETLKALYIEGAAQLLEVFVELLDNSLYFMRSTDSSYQNSISIRLLDSMEQTQEQRMVKGCRVVEVEDSGLRPSSLDGMDIFSPFVSVKLNHQGSGTGLYRVRKILRELGGDITLNTQKKNVSFLVSLKCKGCKI